MDGNIIIDFNKIEETISNLNSYVTKLEESFDRMNNYYSSLKQNDIWYGKSNDVCTRKCDELSKQYPDIIDSLKVYISFLDRVKVMIKEYDDNLDQTITEEFG